MNSKDTRKGEKVITDLLKAILDHIGRLAIKLDIGEKVKAAQRSRYRRREGWVA